MKAIKIEDRKQLDIVLTYCQMEGITWWTGASVDKWKPVFRKYPIYLFEIEDKKLAAPCDEESQLIEVGGEIYSFSQWSNLLTLRRRVAIAMKFTWENQ